MLKERISYVDFNGVSREDEFHFHISKPELVEMGFAANGGMEEKIKTIAATEDHGALVKLLKELILTAYGEKSDDGRRFIKSKQLSTEFSQTEAYAQLFMRLASDADALAAFVNGIMPSDLVRVQESSSKVVGNA